MSDFSRYTVPVAQFMTACDQPFPSNDEAVELNRLNMLYEEVKETRDALNAEDFVEVADGIIDIIYVAAGGYLELNLPTSDVAYSLDEHDTVEHLGRIGYCNLLITDLVSNFRKFDSVDGERIVKTSCSTLSNTDLIRQSMVTAERIGEVLGFDLPALFDEVQRSNMSKVMPDGKVIKNEYGKVMKPSSFFRPNLLPIMAPWLEANTHLTK